MFLSACLILYGGGRRELVSLATTFMDYNNKSPWRQEITTAKIQIRGRVHKWQWRLLARLNPFQTMSDLQRIFHARPTGPGSAPAHCHHSSSLMNHTPQKRSRSLLTACPIPAPAKMTNVLLSQWAYLFQSNQHVKMNLIRATATPTESVDEIWKAN